MLLLVAAFGIVFWEASRRRRLARKGRTTPAPDSPSALASLFEPSSPEFRAGSSLPNGAVLKVKQELSALSPDVSSADAELLSGELLAGVLREGEAALPELCNLLKVSSNGDLLADATELLALLSPSRRGLQAAICDAGAVPLLLRLVAHSTSRQPLPRSDSSIWRFMQLQDPTQIQNVDQSRTSGLNFLERDQEKGHRPRKVAAQDCAGESGASWGASSGHGHSFSGQGNARASDGVLTDPVVLSYVLRTLVNLTSNGRTGAPVRQAILADSAVMEALMSLLHVPEEDELTWQGASDSSRQDGARASHATAPPPVGEAASAADAGVPLSPAGSSLTETRWHSAGLAAWLLAHLCSMPVGQLQLVQEGVVLALVRLVRQGRMAWAAAAEEGAATFDSLAAEGGGGQAAEAAAAAAVAATAGARKGIGGSREERTAAAAAARGQVSYTPTNGRLLPHASSTLLYDAAAAAYAAAGGSPPRASTMPYMMAAVQYGLMALVNITFDNSANQRSVAQAGMLSELEALFVALLQPGALLPRMAAASLSPASPSSWSSCSGVAAAVAAAAAAEGAQRQQPRRRSQLGAGPEREEGTGGDGGGGRNAAELNALLRGGYLGVGKFAVWLLAHLSSSDPDLKADIAGPAFSFVPQLLEFMMLPDTGADTDTDKQQELPPPSQPQSAQHQADPPRCPSEQRGGTAAAAASTAAPTDGGGGGTSSAVQQKDGASAAAAASGGVLVVRQYAAMALVNLTCGVPSTKATVARAMDWDGMAALLQWLAGEHESAMAAAAAEVAAAAPTATEAAGGTAAHAQSAPTAAAAAAASSSSGPVSDLLLYTVWLLQHLSLSPAAAAAADPRVVPPLVSLLAAPDAHVRLRASAAIGALCSASLPAEATGSGTSTGGAGASRPQHPHRAAFLASGGVRRLLAAARRERDPHLLAYGMLCLSSAVGDDDVAAVAEAVAGGALVLLEGLMASEHSACLLPAAEALQALARAAHSGLQQHMARTRTSYHPSPALSSTAPAAAATAAAASAAEAAAAAALAASAVDYVPCSLLSRVVAIMLTHSDPGVRAAMNEALGAVTALPGVRERYCAVFAATLRDLVSAAEVELQVIPVN